MRRRTRGSQFEGHGSLAQDGDSFLDMLAGGGDGDDSSRRAFNTLLRGAVKTETAELAKRVATNAQRLSDAAQDYAQKQEVRHGLQNAPLW